MHFADESYVRKYPRKTLTSRLLRWEGRAVLDAMLGEFDRAGVFELAGDPAECIATVTEIPIEIVRLGLERLIATRTWVVSSAAIVWPTYVEAQTCGRSDRARQRSSREQRAAKAANGVASRNGPDDPEPETAPPSQPVTAGHNPSRIVTPSLAIPSRSSLPERAPAGARDGGKPKPKTERRWPRFPAGWRWSDATTAAAAELGLAAGDLQAHVDYWTVRPFAVPPSDLDGELRRSLAGIAERKRGKTGAQPGAPPDSYAWTPTAEHRALALLHGFDLRAAVAAYRETGAPDTLGTLRANEDFTRRLRCWALLGGAFLASGKLPRRPREPEPDAAAKEAGAA